MVQSATALLACGRIDTARRALVYLACTQRPDGGFAQNFWIDGTPYWTGIQLDEVAFPIMLAWRLWKVDGLGSFDVLPFVTQAAAFLCRYAPVTQQERWEENAGYSPSTLAAVISGLLCASDIVTARGNEALGVFYEDYADWIEAHLDEWTTTTEGVLHPEVKCHYMRIRPPAPGEPFHNDSIPPGTIRIANRGPGEKDTFDAREVVDGGFLELVRYGVRRADDPLMIDSIKVIDRVLKIDTPYGPCWRRYNHDGYGQRKDGGPYLGWGQGRAWPIMTGERAHYELSAGQNVTPYITALEHFSSIGGMLPEQVWDYADMPAEGLYFGRSAGSAQPLVWAHAEYVKLLRSVADGRVFDRISVVEERYAVAQRPAQLHEPHGNLPALPPHLGDGAGRLVPHHRRATLPGHMDRRRLGDHDPHRVHRHRPPGLIRRHLHLAADHWHPHLHALLARPGPLARTQHRGFHQYDNSPNHARRSEAKVVARSLPAFLVVILAEDLLCSCSCSEIGPGFIPDTKPTTNSGLAPGHALCAAPASPPIYDYRPQPAPHPLHLHPAGGALLGLPRLLGIQPHLSRRP